MGSTSPPKFEGWLGLDANSIGNMKWGEFEPKKWTEDDVDIEISHCGVCGTDLHTLRSGWGPTPYRTSLPTYCLACLPIASSATDKKRRRDCFVLDLFFSRMLTD